MKILIIGSGGREHALAWKLSRSPEISEVFCAPGNGGIAEVATCIPLKTSQMDELLYFAREKEVDLTVIGPDDALAAGIVDRFQAAGLAVFGPTQEAARLESSKVFAKEFMVRHGIPTAVSERFSDPAAATEAATRLPKPLVIKADGLALGKGVIIAQTDAEAREAIQRIMVERLFGDAGREIIIEEFLEGVECSIHALVDGSSYLLFPGAQDHKRALDGDQGLNTGGMGTFSPSVALTPELQQQVRTDVLDRFIAGLKSDDLRYQGMLFPGLMITRNGIRVLEFNCRFGDPETQVLLVRLESDLLPLLQATVHGTLHEQRPHWSRDAAVCVIMASGGYPEEYATGKPIRGLEEAREEAVVFHAGTRVEDGHLVTSGGRVLGVTAKGRDLDEARILAYGAVKCVNFDGAHYRKDIGARTHI